VVRKETAVPAIRARRCVDGGRLSRIHWAPVQWRRTLPARFCGGNQRIFDQPDEFRDLATRRTANKNTIGRNMDRVRLPTEPLISSVRSIPGSWRILLVAGRIPSAWTRLRSHAAAPTRHDGLFPCYELAGRLRR